MPTYEFTLWIEVPKTRDHVELSNALFDAGCDDGSPGCLCGEWHVNFHRQARSLDEAVRTAHRDVDKAGCRAIRLEMQADELDRCAQWQLA